MVAVPRMLERRLRDDEAPHRVAEMLEIFDGLQRVRALRRAHRDPEMLVELVEERELAGARFGFRDEAQGVGVDRLLR